MGNVNPFDFIVLVVLVLSTFWGGLRGVVSQIAAIATWIISWQLASRYYGVVDRFVAIDEPWRRPIASLIVFLVSAVALSFAARFLKKTLSLAGFKEFDRQTGALFGLLKGLLICVVLAFFATIVSAKTTEALAASKSGRFFVSIASSVVSKTCADSDVGRRFLATADATFGAEPASETVKTLDAEVDELKTYLKKNVLSPTAAEIVDEADAAENDARQGKSTAKPASKRPALWDFFRGDVSNERDDATNEPRSNAAPGAGRTRDRSASADDVAPKNPNELENFATFFRKTFGGVSTETADASAIRSAVEDVASASSNYLDEFLGPKSSAKRTANGETPTSKRAPIDAETGLVGESTPTETAENVGAFDSSDDDFWRLGPSRTQRLRAVPPPPY